MDNVKHLITTDKFSHNCKPSKEDIADIHKNLIHVLPVSIDELATIVAQPIGATFCPVNFNGRERSNDNFVSQSIFALDFDGNIIPEDAIKRFEKYGLMPNLYYTTFSDTPEKRKFRIVMFLDTIITDRKQRDHIALSLLKLFPEADNSCKDASRMFFGGKESFILNRENVPFSSLIEVLDINNITNDNGKLRSVTKSKGLGVWLNLGKPLLYNKDIPKNDQRYIDNYFNLGKATEEVKILNDFATGKWIHHPQLFGIATNLIWVKGGAKWMKEVMTKFNADNEGKYLDGKEMQYSDNNFNIIPYVKKREYNPSNLSNFSPYEEDHIHTNIITSVSNTRGMVEQIDTIDKKSLEEVETQFKEEFTKAIESSDSNIYIFRLPTGLGKTEALTIKDHKAVIAVPTHKLKEEIYGRATYDCLATPELPVLEDKNLMYKIEYLYSIGASKKVYTLLDSISKDKHLISYSHNDIQAIREYLSEIRSLYQENRKTIITTFQRGILNKFKHDTLIFDEDPIDSLFVTNTMKITDLFRLELVAGSTELKDLLDFLRNSYAGMVNKTPILTMDTEKLMDLVVEQHLSSNVLDFFNSNYFMKDSKDSNLIHYITTRQLPADKKIIIMSASIPAYIYKKMYGDRVKEINISDVRMMGKIVQNTRKSYSRKSLATDLDPIVKEVGDRLVITFVKYKKKFKNPVDHMHFGNCSGYDDLKGKDLAVVGTPHQPQYKYFLLASAIGIEYKNADTIMSVQKIEWNGFRFMFNSFESDELQAIQLSLIESELIQAVGRNRTLRTDATTYIYSNLPLRLVDDFINEKIEYKDVG